MNPHDNALNAASPTQDENAPEAASGALATPATMAETSEDNKVRQEKVTTPQSFIDFVRHYGTIESIVFLDVNNGKAFSILNYVARRPALDLENEENGDSEDNGDDEDEMPSAFYDTPQPSFHCNWQLTYELSYTQEWQQLDALTQQPFPEREGILKLLQLRDYFVEPDDDFDEAISFRETEIRTFLPKILDVDATPATDDEMVRLVLEKKSSLENLLINFALPVHAGCIAHEALLLVNRKDGNISFDLINREQIMLASAKSSIAKIRTNLSDTFPVFDTDLDHFEA
jgi:hypothetical protein